MRALGLDVKLVSLHECQGFREERLGMPALPADAPPCTRLCGFFLEIPEVIAYEQELQRTIDPPCPRFDEHAAAHFTQHTRTGEVVVYTDGSCHKTRLARLRRAGSGCWWAEGHPLNHSAPVRGAQTNQRAELQAAVRAAEADPRQLQIRTDSKYVILGARNPQSRGSHADLWARLVPHLHRVSFYKVKGHATWSDVRLGFSSAADKIGNAKADKLANRGSEMHPASPALEEAVESQKQLAKSYQKSLINILREHDKAVKEFDEAEALFGPPPPVLQPQGFAMRGRKRRVTAPRS